jgi:hypothetical protein
LVTPLELSKVSRVAAGVQATPDPAVRVTVTTPRIKMRTAVPPPLANGRLADAICPVARVKVAAVPIAVPAALKNAMLPVQDAAGPLDDALARFTTAIWAVSVLPNPTRNVRITVAPLCAMATAMLHATVVAATNRLNNI